jgi:hypothetical protein
LQRVSQKEEGESVKFRKKNIMYDAVGAGLMVRGEKIFVATDE